MRSRRRGGLLSGADGAILVWGGLALLIGFGWGLNIVELAGTSFSPITGLAILRVIGVFIPPLGAILGYFV